MTSSPTKAERFWINFGKVCAVLGLVGTCVALFNTFFPTGEADLSVAVYSESFIYPPGIQNAVEAAKELVSYRSLEQNLENALPEHEDIRPYNIASQLSEEIENVWPAMLDRGLPYVDGFLTIVIENEGDAEAENVVVDLPLEGFAELTIAEGRTSITAFENSIAIGSIRGKTTATLRAWTRSKLPSYRQDDIQVTFKQGLANTRISHHTFGVFDAAVVSFGGLIGFAMMIPILALFFVFLYGVHVGGKQSPAPTDPDDDPPAA